MITPLIIANWKMAIDADGVEAFKATWNSKPSIHGIEAVVAPPAPYLPLVQGLSQLSCVLKTYQRMSRALTQVRLPHHAHDFGCQYVLVGHSERRQNQGETNAIVAQKAKRAQAGA